eukprot:Plantae.Rhodophyta-Purpureofilum_apyrenoidigerum.ctg35994.p1 GENE.Plantae.Rhodophyta-Purpureofilum_apyrenoidigerum.ctg35994~~Plantae.Rhodophyta-Purpureofilum_apyrenoidigerum.ctg35994.p1  ORF type:complete len:351 (-),score=76.26 Plantae.Rhodophyta-Purpureofilum_apyrenoidigerum.ctg35994:386-1438(-)
MVAFCALGGAGLKSAGSRRAVCRRRAAEAGVRRRVIAAETYYEVLHVSPDADMATIKKAYRKEALRNHPDVARDPGASDRFIAVQKAYKVLSDAKTKAKYDREIQSRSRTSSYSGASSGSSSARTSSGFSDFGKTWKQSDGPFPEDINDSFGSIFNDLFSGVSKGVSGVVSGIGSGNVASDFVEFLESQFGIPSRSGIDDLLRNGTIEELEAELDDVSFVIEQLGAREKRLTDERDSAQRLAQQWSERSERSTLDTEARESAQQRATAFRREVSRSEQKLREIRKMIKEQNVFVARLKVKMAAKEGEEDARNHAENARTHAKMSIESERERVAKEVEDELDRLKKQLGMS